MLACLLEALLASRRGALLLEPSCPVGALGEQGVNGASNLEIMLLSGNSPSSDMDQVSLRTVNRLNVVNSADGNLFLGLFVRIILLGFLPL
jgi:hypothetical protein